MKSISPWLGAGLLLASSCFSNASAAQADGNMLLGVQVDTSCIIRSAQNMNFGVYDTVAANNEKTGQSTIVVRCIMGSTGVRLALNEGQNPAEGSSCSAPVRRLRSEASGQHLHYNLYSNSSRTSVFGCQAGSNDHLYPAGTFTNTYSDVNLTVYGKVMGGQDVRAGEYADTITINLTF